jgi:hypothetical protein
VKVLCTVAYKTLMKKIEKDTNVWKDISSSWIGRANIKIFILPEMTPRFNKSLLTYQ